MEPPHERGGEPLVGELRRRDAKASMEPPHERGGEGVGGSLGDIADAASMEPPHERGGESSTSSTWTARRSLQWSRRMNAAESSTKPPSADRSSAGFNGAAA